MFYATSIIFFCTCVHACVYMSAHAKIQILFCKKHNIDYINIKLFVTKFAFCKFLYTSFLVIDPFKIVYTCMYIQGMPFGIKDLVI